MRNVVRVTFATFLLLAMFADRVEAQTPWRLRISSQSCNLNDPKVGSCTSDVWVYNSSTGDIYLCTGTMASIGRPRTPPTVSTSCRKHPSPVAGNMEFAAPLPVMPLPAQTYTYSGAKLADFRYFYWVIGQDIKDLRFCYTPTLVCTTAPPAGL
jgi:hypothetical protein